MGIITLHQSQLLNNNIEARAGSDWYQKSIRIFAFILHVAVCSVKESMCERERTWHENCCEIQKEGEKDCEQTIIFHCMYRISTHSRWETAFIIFSLLFLFYSLHVENFSPSLQIPSGISTLPSSSLFYDLLTLIWVRTHNEADEHSVSLWAQFSCIDYC